MPKRPSDKAIHAARKRHSKRAIRETIAYRLGWPEKSAALLFAWEGCITLPRKPHFKDYVKLLKSDLPVLANNLESGDL